MHIVMRSYYNTTYYFNRFTSTVVFLTAKSAKAALRVYSRKSSVTSKLQVPFNRLSWKLVGTQLEIVQPKDLALRRSDKILALIGGHFPNFKSSVPFNRWSSKLVGTLPEMVQTIVPKDFTQYCSSPPLCTMISYGYTLSLQRTYLLPQENELTYMLNPGLF